jgi:hypothetical protein
LLAIQCIAVLVRGDGGWIEVRDRVWLEIEMTVGVAAADQGGRQPRWVTARGEKARKGNKKPCSWIG